MKLIKFTIFLFVFWMAIFSLFRVIFLLYNVTLSWSSALAFLYGLKQDIAVSCYLLSIPLIVQIIPFGVMLEYRVKQWFLLPYSFLLFVTISLIELSSIPLYSEWGTTFNSKAMGYLYSIPEALIAVQTYITFLYVFLFIAITTIGFVILKKIHSISNTHTRHYIKRFFICIGFIGVAILGARGGFQKIPLNISSAFYSSDQTNNYTAVNKAFYLIKSITQNDDQSIGNKKFSDQELKELYTQLYLSSTDTADTSPITTTRPNIVMIILEGWPADVVKELGGLSDVCPEFSKLTKDGLLFENIYSSGTRTGPGLLSILSGLPALPYLNVMNGVEYVNRLPCIFDEFKENIYFTSFLYGGSVDFSNFNNYFLAHHTDEIISESSFSITERSTAWGVPDNLLFERSIKQLNKQNQPFFSCILTQSSHTPFDIPEEHRFPGESEPEKFKSSVSFSDKYLGRFFEQVKKQTWYDNTVFVILADHGSLHLEDRDYNDHRRFQIPFLIYGNPLDSQFKGKTISTTGNHHDVPKTLLSALGMDSQKFIFSKNLLADSVSEFAYWSTDHTLGWITSSQKMVVNIETEAVYSSTPSAADSLQNKRTPVMYYKLVYDYLNQ